MSIMGHSKAASRAAPDSAPNKSKQWRRLEISLGANLCWRLTVPPIGWLRRPTHATHGPRKSSGWRMRCTSRTAELSFSTVTCWNIMARHVINSHVYFILGTTLLFRSSITRVELPHSSPIPPFQITHGFNFFTCMIFTIYNILF